MKKMLLSESDKKAIISQREKIIMENFVKTFNKIKRVDENEMGGVETIYIDNKLSDYFDVPYQNDGEQTVINSGALRDNSTRGWDSKHLAIFDKYAGKDLILIGKGFGWWEIKKIN
jgi:hypothetical protein